MTTGFERLAVPLKQVDGTVAGWWLIEAGSAAVSLELEACALFPGALPDGWKGKRAAEADEPLQLTYRAGRQYVQLQETLSYEWRIEWIRPVSGCRIHSSLESQKWKIRRGESGEFRVVNHLGMADFSVTADGLIPCELDLEVVSGKLDYETEYRQMTEDIADFCQQLLLSWDAPTGLQFSADAVEENRLLLEQFLFLRHFLTEERLNRLLEAIGRNPHSRLVHETRWVPAGMAGSTEYLSDPMRMLRGWEKHAGRPEASEVSDVRKSDTYDTEPNRFIKFALSAFRQMCAEVYAAKWKENGKPSALGVEAYEMQEMLDALLGRRFFRGVGQLQRLPMDNQTLQKREGYREVLQAWLLSRAAVSLSWEGEQDCYRGNTRNVATLYEYWIFIQLHELLKSMDGMQLLQGDGGEEDFISEDGGQLTVNLKSGKRSRSSYLWQGESGGLRLDLHYERSFSFASGATASGSYSRRFRPDYTLSIFPAAYKSETQAEQEGKLVHLHFDAKYRAEDAYSLFGSREPDDDEISREKQEAKSERTYRRGDLLKMHTYNDALRHTIGSYVLYPGSDKGGAEKLGKFHEIAPGVGALVMKPGQASCINALTGFIRDVLDHQSDRFSQFSYVSESSYRTYRKEPGKISDAPTAYRVARKDAPCVVLWLRKEHEPLFKANGFAYCRVKAGEDKSVLNLNLSIEVGSEFIPCGGGQGVGKTGYGWRAKVRSARFIAREKLRDFLEEQGDGLLEQLSPSSTEHYILYQFDEVAEFDKLQLNAVYRKYKSGSDYMAVSCSWSEILDNLPSVD